MCCFCVNRRNAHRLETFWRNVEKSKTSSQLKHENHFQAYNDIRQREFVVSFLALMRFTNENVKTKMMKAAKRERGEVEEEKFCHKF